MKTYHWFIIVAAVAVVTFATGIAVGWVGHAVAAPPTSLATPTVATVTAPPPAPAAPAKAKPAEEMKIGEIGVEDAHKLMEQRGYELEGASMNTRGERERWSKTANGVKTYLFVTVKGGKVVDMAADVSASN